MDNLKISEKRGMTIVEVMISLAIGIVGAFIITTVVISGMSFVRSTRKSQRLHADASAITGIAYYWIKQAQKVEVPVPSTLEIFVPDSDPSTDILVKKVLEKSGNFVNFEGVPITSDGTIVNNLIFTKLERSARLAFSLQRGGETFSAMTTVAIRND